MKIKQIAAGILLMTLAAVTHAQSDTAFEKANCNASFLQSCSSGGAAAPMGLLGESPMEVVLLALVGVLTISKVRKSKKQK